ncbi:hypothetical protein PFICI_07658 [Pestalotiopsis fici W106-1]|uniref:C2H2-type domain-containing protein n=1 Tax=Pestalotiopsis fici (strain W106-1 / CGMCC3.15140) TaxID=1229662 RepID=W3X281_PESFW|nr:uncharacterized protein PFICI_07658 [Pestalotiopsis fici W106-1]ETS80129.1 hypothetical protein PFICI_07658 [Pestalotiopsis fici W106-1]
MESSHDLGYSEADLLNSLQTTSLGYHSSITTEELENLQNLLVDENVLPTEHDVQYNSLSDYPSQPLEMIAPWQAHAPLVESQAIPVPALASNQTLPRRRSRYLRNGSARNASSEPVTPAQSSLNPMQRWQESPPETEGASLLAIAGALRNSPRHTRSAERLKTKRWSVATSDTSLDSADTGCSSQSIASSRSTTSRREKPRSRHASRARTTLNRSKSGAQNGRIFQCTFCCDTFKNKYDWSRHEKSLHLSVERWICTPFGGAIVSPLTGQNHCVYCNLPDVSQEHLVKTHAHGSCEGENQVREFGRRDHLVQHLRQIHKIDAAPACIDDWKVDAPPIACRCGFCNTQLNSWKERADHLARHFRDGSTMDDWQGDHGFEKPIASQVNNAIPPYLIGAESRSLVPFSATSSRTKDHLHQIMKSHDEWAAELGGGESHQSNPIPNQEQVDETGAQQSESAVSKNFVHFLTSGLARFARQQMSLGVVPSDEMFQNESRRLVYGSQDGWDQTIADNNQWLSTFRSTHLGPNDDSQGSGHGNMT